jgi:hypothetical protein
LSYYDVIDDYHYCDAEAIKRGARDGDEGA